MYWLYFIKAAKVGKTEPLSDEFFTAEPNGASKKLTGLSVTPPVKVLSDSDLKKSPTATSVMTSATLTKVPSEALLQVCFVNLILLLNNVLETE